MKILKKTLTLFSFLFLLQVIALAQPEGDTFPDFTVTDIEGNTHHLQSYLDDGKMVLIDVFATWCSICISSLPAIDELYETHGPDGDNTLVILSFEKDAGTSNEEAFVSTYNIPNPVIADGLDEVAEWNTIYQPNFFVICVDGSFDYHFSGVGSNPAVLEGLIDDCEAISTGIPIYEDEFAFQFFSNPVTNELLFELKNEYRFRYSIIDLSGKVLLRENSTSIRNSVDVTFLENGIYLLQLEDESGTNITRKFIKN